MRTDLESTIRYELNTRTFFLDLFQFCKGDKFVDDFRNIELEAPDVAEAFVHDEVCHIGDPKKKRNGSSGLNKVMEMYELLCRAVTTAGDRNSIVIVTKQRNFQY